MITGCGGNNNETSSTSNTNSIKITSPIKTCKTIQIPYDFQELFLQP